MWGLIKPLVATIAILSTVKAHPLADFTFSENPAYAVKRALYDLSDLSDQGHKDKLTQGLKDAVILASKTIDKMDDDKHKDKLEGWFGKENSDDNARETIKQVFKNFVGSNTDGTGAEVLGKVHVYKDDYWKPTSDQIGPGDGKTPFCDLKDSKGLTASAYFKTNNKIPAMHYCDKVWDRGDWAALTANKCGSLGNIMGAARMTKKFIGANVLHEFMHFPRIGKDAIGSQIVDYAYHAFGCRKLALNDDVAERKKTINNADTYVWFALHIALTEECGEDFTYPRGEQDDNSDSSDDADQPDSDPPTNETGTCNCNESGCTVDSPACCANGTC